MKTRATINPWSGLLAMGISMAILSTVAIGADEQRDSGRFTEMNWQEKMSETFRDTWRGLWQDKDAKNIGDSTLATASVDLREQQDSYTLRLNLPNRDVDKVKINLSGETLRIVAPAEGKAGRYEQDIRLEGVDANATPQIERRSKDNLVVVTVPKSSEVASTKPPASPWRSNWDAWDRDVLEQMARMQREMDRIFSQAFSEFRSQPELAEFFDQARFGSSLDLQEEKDKYVVRVYLPDREMDNVNVTIEGQVLKLEAKGENTRREEKEGVLVSRKAQYSQVLTLPGPVQTDKMTVERKENMLVVTLPKASAS